MLECPTHNSDPTIAQHQDEVCLESTNSRDCCLVQIYPTNIIDGLMKLDSNGLTIGRDATNHLALTDGSVSRHHAILEPASEGFRVRDLGSTNGTFVNDQRVSDYLLQGGEIIRFGSFIFKFLAANAIETHYHSTVYDAMTRDGLTGAFNKNYLLDSLTHEIARHRRCERPLSVLLMDIDHFKKINDTYGHLVGDEILREFAQRVSHAKREDDLLCRYGGEEFVLILGETSLVESLNIAEKCRRSVAEKPHPSASGDLSVTVSIGAAQLPIGASTLNAQSLLKIADDHLYRAKENGRNQVCG